MREITIAREAPVATSNNAATTSNVILIATEAVRSVKRAMPTEASANDVDVNAARNFRAGVS